MVALTGSLIETDILVIGGGGGGLVAALSAKRHASPGTRVTVVDSWTIGRTGHAAFSNGWTVVVTPDDDLEGTTREIIAGNDWIADQILVRDVLAMSWDRLRDLEKLELVFNKDSAGRYVRRPTRGLELTRVLYPEGGGLELCWRLRRGLEAEGVQLLDRIFITGLMRGATGQVVGAVGVHSRTGRFHVIQARATIVATNAVTFRSGFVRDLTGTGTLLAYKAGATLRNAEFGYVRPGTPKFYFEGITFAIQEGARFVNRDGEQFMKQYEPEWGDECDVPRIARAMAMERRRGRDPLHLDMSGVPEDKRDYFIHSKVKWMSYFFRKLGQEARTDMFAKTPYYPQSQMTKMAIRTDSSCRSDVPGLLAAGLAQAGCSNHFAGFHIGMCIGTGWIVGQSAVEELDRLGPPRLDPAEIAALHDETFKPLDARAEAESDRLLREFQSVMFAYDVAILKTEERLKLALSKLQDLAAEFREAQAPHTHELVRLKETEAMFLAAEIILQASLYRKESRLSHFREDFESRDDENWMVWVDAHDAGGRPALESTPIPTPLCSVGSHRTHGRFAANGGDIASMRPSV